MKSLQSKLILLITLLTTQSVLANRTTPKLTVIMVIDQFAYHYLYKLKPFFTGAFKQLLNDSIMFENAHYPHAVPETAPGHTCLNTGVLPSEHGIVGNIWVDPSGKEVESDDADPKTNGVFSKGCEVTKRGKSSANVMVDGLSDQFVMQTQPNQKFVAYSLSIKSRSAIMTSTKLGKAIWLDKDTGLFTTSKAYFDQVPEWVTQFNKANKIDCTTSVQWDLVFPKNNAAYQFKHIENYKYIGDDKTSIGRQMPINRCCSGHDEVFAPVYESPLGNHLILNLARDCVKTHLKKDTHLLLWVCLTPLDLVGHRYGPDSLEAIDMIYHLDKQLKPFMHDMQKAAGKNDVVFALTADHGILQLQGVLQEEGIKTAYRISTNNLLKDLNGMINEKYKIEGLVAKYQPSQFFFDHEKGKKVDPQVKKAIVQDIKTTLMAQPGIKNVWTYDELSTLPFNVKQQELESYYKNQRYPGRSGDIFVQPQPYTLLTAYAHGTSHASPYNYDTHVPLFIYQKGKYERKRVTEKVYMTQFANTMAQILDVPKPSASTAQLLPGIFKEVAKEAVENEDEQCAAAAA